MSYSKETEPLSGFVQAPAICVFPLNRVEACLGLESREPGCLSPSATPEEGGKSPVKPLERPPAHHYPVTQDLGPDLSQLGQCSALVYVGDRPVFPLPGTSPLLQGGVVELTLFGEETSQGLALFGRWLEEISV